MTTAKVETLTAEVRVLMVGNRQVTLSVYKQLDQLPAWEIEPFGRVHAGGPTNYFDEKPLELVGRDKDGNLVRARNFSLKPDNFPLTHDDWKAVRAHWASLPLIVLAGLR
jgi:hypothetical protein